jgi:hypothetical protein
MFVFSCFYFSFFWYVCLCCFEFYEEYHVMPARHHRYACTSSPLFKFVFSCYVRLFMFFITFMCANGCLLMFFGVCLFLFCYACLFPYVVSFCLFVLYLPNSKAESARLKFPNTSCSVSSVHF